jgi:hypothetical protein
MGPCFIVKDSSIGCLSFRINPPTSSATTFIDNQEFAPTTTLVPVVAPSIVARPVFVPTIALDVGVALTIVAAPCRHGRELLESESQRRRTTKMKKKTSKNENARRGLHVIRKSSHHLPYRSLFCK